MTVLEKDWLQHCATREQLDFFNEQGYLVVENALSEAQVEEMTVAIDRVDAAERRALEKSVGRLSLSAVVLWAQRLLALRNPVNVHHWVSAILALRRCTTRLG